MLAGKGKNRVGFGSNPNKAELFEGSFSWGQGGVQFEAKDLRSKGDEMIRDGY